MIEQQSKKKTKQVLLNRIKTLNTKPEVPQQMPMNMSMQMPMQMPMQMQMQMPNPNMVQNQPPMKIDTEEDFRKMPYEGKAKYDNQLKALNAMKNQTEEKNQKPKKMFFEHYDTVEAYCPIIQNNSNPSGRPPNIPPQMYQGITVKPKRPWVYIGTQNLPPVQYQQINQANFKSIQKKNIEPGKQQKKRQPTGLASKPRKKPNQQKMQSQYDHANSNQISNEIDIEQGESIFASRYNQTDSKYLESSRKSKMSKRSEPSFGDDYDQSDGTETKKGRVDIFQSGENQGYDVSEYDEDSELESKSKSKQKGQMSKKDIKKKKKEQEFSD